MSVTDHDFDFIRKLVFDQAGIVLESGKQYLVEARLGPLAKRLGMEDISTLAVALRRRNAAVERDVVEALTTNETTFFRDIEPFEALRKHIIPKLIETRGTARTLRFWYGASSTGQEPYSVVMMLREHFPQLASWNVTHVATDINLDVLARAREGRYSQIEINRGLPVTYLLKYFQKEGLAWRLKPEIRDCVRFEQMNLVKDWPLAAPFDVIMLRNVMIYFDIEAKKKILGRIRRRLSPEGYLLLGAAETTFSLDDAFTRVQFDKTGCYTLGHAAAQIPVGVRGAA